MHTNKLLNVWGRNRMADSADLWDIARSVILIGDTSDDGIKYMSHEKNNYGRTNETILFRNDGGQPTYWATSNQKDRDFVLEASRIRNSEKKGDDVEEVESMILSELMNYPEGLTTKELESLVVDTGYSWRSLKQAKTNLKQKRAIRYEKTGMKDPWRVKKA